MFNRSAKSATYPRAVAKMEINFPEDLIRGIDVAADRLGQTRDEFLERVAEHEVDRLNWQLRRELEQMVGPAQPMGGNAAEIIREMRDSRPRARRGNSDEE